MTVVVVLRHLGSLSLWRHAVAALTSNITNSFNAILIILFGILSGPGALLIGSFYMVSFISFINIM